MGGVSPGGESDDDNNSKGDHFRDGFNDDGDGDGNENGKKKSNDTGNEEDSNVKTPGDNAFAESHYPRCQRRLPKDWSMLSDTSSSSINMTKGDESTMRKALTSTSEERDFWLSARDDEILFLNRKDTRVHDDNTESLPLPTHVVLKVKRSPSGSFKRFEVHIVAGGIHRTYGEDFIETYAPVLLFTLIRVFLYLTIFLGIRVA